MVALRLRDFVDDVHARGDLPEYGVLPVEPWALVRRDDEELAPVRIGPGVRHRERAADDAVVVRLVVERVAGATGAVALRAAALDHEAVDHAVESKAVVEPFARQAREI